jgi:hypothetical protein
MPTYQNITNGVVQVEGIIFQPYGQKGDTKAIKKQLDSSALTMLYSYPYWNPATATHEITTVSPSGGYETIELDEESESVEVYNSSNVTVNIYLNSLNNTPAMVVPSNSVRYIEGLKGTTNRIIVHSEGTVNTDECFITELL